ncbi:hypothetical protein PANT_22c00310 [Moesziomyces antarcticus T-34]|uniref:DUF4042 domain-containing protein n=1 Tax=Pseudozyma antarctica (strain T-34) TaxID=1151754 RepID=M9M7E2_PSEA3|nr:hypothetical protein PANT_22c00310 [Moesziomyces antarcticus T-34]
MEAAHASQGAEALLDKLRESRLSSDERRTSLEALRLALEPIVAPIISTTFDNDGASISLLVRAIQDGPNDVRRVALQTISSGVDKVETPHISQATSDKLIAEIEALLKSTLKIQSGRSIGTLRSRPRIDVSTISTSSLRAAAAALKAIHSLLRIAPTDKPAARASDTNSLLTRLTGLLDVVVPCLYAGLSQAGPSKEPGLRASSGLRSGALSWMDPSRQPLSRARGGHTSAAETDGETDRFNASSSGEADRRSDKSESERSDFSVASSRSASRSRKDESRQQDATCRLIRQNALHCLVELNRRHANAIVARWTDLLPDQLAQPVAAARAMGSGVVSRRSGVGSSVAFSLCSLILEDPSTSVRLAAVSALESVLTHGTRQLSMAQERAQRALTFTSLSSQLAGWIVNVRSYVVLALQRAAIAPRTPARVEGQADGAGSSYPTALLTALLRLARTFVTSTTRARLVVKNAAVLAEPAAAFVAHSDPDVQTAAKRLVAALAATQDAAPGASAIRRPPGVAASAYEIAEDSAKSSSLDMTLLLDQSEALTTALAERALDALDQTAEPNLAMWTALVKRLAETASPVLTPATCSRLVVVWQRISSMPRSGDQQCSLLASAADLLRTLSRHTALDVDTADGILSYVHTCSRDPDEAVRAAAVRVLGVVILPPDASSAGDVAVAQVSRVLHNVLWGEGEGERGLLHDTSGLVRQRASWALANSVEARLRGGTGVADSQWADLARYCVAAGRDMEGVAVSACRASGSLLAMLPATAGENDRMAGELVDQLCRVLGAGGKPPKSRWNAASALSRALSSDATVLRVLASGEKLDRVTELLCLSLDTKVFKIRVSAAHALLSLVGADESRRLEVLGTQRCARIQGIARARLTQLTASPASQTKEAGLYTEELQRLLERLVARLSTNTH